MIAPRPSPLAGACPSAFLAAALTAVSPAAAASERWTAADAGAEAILPDPLDARVIAGGTLSCAEQRWSFLFRLEPDAIPPGMSIASRIVVEEEIFEAPAFEKAGSLLIEARPETLEPLKSGRRLVVAVGGDPAVALAVFPLSGSRKAIDQAASRCTPVDMSAYRPVTLAPEGPGAADALALMAGEMSLFRAATGRQPALASALIELGAGRRLLFASVCGSNTYYGRTGCTLSGFAAEAGEAWREAYNTEGVYMHLDPRSANGGWPNLVTLPTVGGVEPYHWVWNGTAYDNMETIVAEEDAEPVEEEGDAAQ